MSVKVEMDKQFIIDFEKLKRKGLNDVQVCEELGYSTTWMYAQFKKIGYIRPNFKREFDEEFLVKYKEMIALGMQKIEIADELETTVQTLYDTLKRLGYDLKQEEKDKQEARLAIYWDLKSKGVQDIHMWRYFGFKHAGSWNNWKDMMLKRGYKL